MVDLDDAFGDGSEDEDEESMTDVEECELLFNVAAEKVSERCSPEALKSQLATFVGVDPMDEETHEKTLEGGLPDDPTAQEEREWVMARAWDLVSEEDETLRNALDQAWEDVEDQ